jgi:hypothetical protein
LFVPSRWRSRRSAELADEFGPFGTEDGELVGVVPGMPAAAAGPADPAATVTAGVPLTRSAAPAPAGPPATPQHGALPQRNGPPGIVY